MQVLSSNPLVQKQAHGESAKLVVQKLVTVLFSSNSNSVMFNDLVKVTLRLCAKDDHHVAM